MGKKLVKQYQAMCVSWKIMILKAACSGAQPQTWSTRLPFIQTKNYDFVASGGIISAEHKGDWRGTWPP